MNEQMKTKFVTELANQEYLGNLGYAKDVVETNDPLGLKIKGDN